MLYKAAICTLNAKYIHSSLAPWCLLAGVEAYAPHTVCAEVVEGTVNEPPAAVLARILAAHPQAVTFSCYLWNITQTLALAQALREQAPTLTIVLGGPEVSYNAPAVLARAPQVDYILCGEGEESLPALLACLARGETPVPQNGASLSAVPADQNRHAQTLPRAALSSAAKRHDTAHPVPLGDKRADTAHCAARAVPTPLAASHVASTNAPLCATPATAATQASPRADGAHSADNATEPPTDAAHCAAPQTVPIPGLCTRAGESDPCVLSGDPPSPYTPTYLAALGGRIAYLETSRGCPYRCAFCLSGRCGTPRWFDVSAAQKNLLTLANSGARTVKLIDRTFNANPAHANALLSFLLAHYGREIPAGVCFHFEVAADILREDTLALLAQAPPGAFQLEIGMQSFHAPTLCAVRRATDVERLQENIRRLAAMGNLHLHIDLIAGLPHEDFDTFAQSFDTAYALQAQMLQLGFLKLLHGAPMREEPEVFPCDFSQEPPYEVTRTPWLSPDALAVLHTVEDALERVYNAGRFRETAAYVLRATGLRPFAFYRALGQAFCAQSGAENAHGTSLDAYTAFLYQACAALKGVERETLRDAMVRDRLATNATGRLPVCLQIRDAALARAGKLLAQAPESAPLPGVRRGVALLYGARQICWADYTAPHPITGRYALHTRPMESAPCNTAGR